MKCANYPLLMGTENLTILIKNTWDKLLQTYKDATDIDPFTGGRAENSPEDGLVGPLFACIIGKQFQNLKDGDRYFHTHTEENNEANNIKQIIGTYRL